MKNNKIKFKKIINLVTSLLMFILFTGSVLIVLSPALADESVDVSGTLTEIMGDGNKEILPGFSTKGHFDASYETGASNITSALLFVVDLIKYFIATVAVVVIIISGIKLVTAGNSIDEVSKNEIENIKYALIGLVVIAVADVMVKEVFFGEYGEVLRSEADAELGAQRGSGLLKSLYDLFKYFGGAIAILMIVYAGIRLLISGGKEEVSTKMKNVIMWAVIGLVLLVLGEYVIKVVIYPSHGEQLSDVGKASELIVMITNFVSGFVATIAVAMYMYAGFLYVISGAGNDSNIEKAKKVVIGASIGLFLALGAFAIANTLIAIEPLGK